MTGTQTDTRGRLQRCALDLFAEKGFRATSVASIAQAAGVSQMTFFRHFPTKESVVVDDPFDPLIAYAVASQPGTLSPLLRASNGLIEALNNPDARTLLRSMEFAEKLRLIVATPELRAAVWQANLQTEAAIAEALSQDNPRVGRPAATAAAAAILAAATALLLEAAESGGDPVDILIDGLNALSETP